MAAGTEFTFVVPGESLPAAGRKNSHGKVREGVRLAATRGAGQPLTVKARVGEHVVRLVIANGPTLVLSPDSAADLVASQDGEAARGEAASPASITVRPQLAWPGAEAAASRDAPGGWLGQATLSSFEVLGDVALDIGVDMAADAAAHLLARKLDAQVDEGVYALDPERFEQPLKAAGRTPIAQVQAAADGGPLLVLVHGTFVESHSTFGKLWAGHLDKVRQLFAAYGGRVYAFDHPTLGESPVRNALALVAALPAGARLHLLTHSRGGLVAEALARACGGDVPPRADLDASDSEGAADLEQLFRDARAKGLRVERMVRVACPARGTLLASRRLDAYLSVLTWALQLAGQPVLGTLVDFLHGIAKKRADPSVLPGLRAMMPESPFIQWLAAQQGPIAGDLRVVAGDIEGDSVVSWVKTLVADAFYWTDNDFVVHTSAMYGGVPRSPAGRAGGAQFMLDRGGKVAHFNYFANDSTVSAIIDALLQDVPAEFAAIGPRSWAGLDTSGARGAPARAESRAPAATRPAVFVLPAFMGSNLLREGRRVWLDWNVADGLAQLPWSAASDSRYAADGPVPQVYDALLQRLADTHEVLPFAYDWRRPLEQEAARLARAVESALDARASTGQPVRLLTHSSGALLARTLQLVRPDVWDRLMKRNGARLLMLAPPNRGSWAPMQMLTGDSGLAQALAAFGSLAQNAAAREVLAGMPGLLQWQAGMNDPAFRLDEEAAWTRLRDADVQALARRSRWHDATSQERVASWPVPPQAVLDTAANLRKKLDDQLQSLHADAENMAIVVGRAPFTPGRCIAGDDGLLEYEDAPHGGDGCVTLDSAQLPGVPMWQVPVSHGRLPQAAEAFAAYLELLSQGKTELLERCEPVDPGVAARGASTSGRAPVAKPLARSRPARRRRDPRPPDSPSELLEGGDARATRAARAALAVRVINADLKFVPEPLMVGHYRSVTLTGSERVVDKLVGGAQRQSLAAGLYPAGIGTHQIFLNERPHPDNPLEMARPRAAIVVGLGEEGKLSATQLAYSIRQAVLAYAQRLSEQPAGASATFELCATLVGSGGPRISAGTAAQAVAQGTLEANQKMDGAGWPRVARLTLVELFLERAAEAWHALRQQEAAWVDRIQVDPFVEQRPGGMRRSVDSSYRGAPYDFISALGTRDAQGNVCIAYELDTRRARNEVRAVHAQTALVRELVATASNRANADPLIGRTLFNLLVPLEIEPYLAGTGEMVLEVDAGTAVIPWELLKSNPDGGSTDDRPWAVRSRLVRKLRTDRFREQVRDAAAQDAVLVIGEPQAPPEYPPLDGALAEAQAVVAQLGTQLAADQVTALVDHPDARAVINGLFERSYRIVHVAGHGAPGPEGGVVLSGNTFLGAKEVAAMRTVPELVFLNCCHLAARDVKDLAPTHDRAQFAANVAEELIAIGVRCVIAAGWAVEDRPAEIFATQFYASLLEGRRFIDAVGAAREAAWKANPDGNTWAAYQCYGDPAWCWDPLAPSDRAPAAAGTDDVGSIASAVGLVVALENLVTEARFGARDPRAVLDRIRFLEGKYGAQWGSQGAVAEAFGLAHAEVQSFPSALAWLQRALACDDGGASLRSVEQLANVRTRVGEEGGDADMVRAGIAELERLQKVSDTAQKVVLLGSAYKRLAMVTWRQRGGEKARDASAAARKCAECFREALHRSQAADPVGTFYPARAALGAELVVAMIERGKAEAPADAIEAVVRMTQCAAEARPDFWTIAGVSYVQVVQGLLEGNLAGRRPAIEAEFGDLHDRVPAPRLWDSVHNEVQFMLDVYRGLPRLRAEEREAVDGLLALLQSFEGKAA